MSGMPTPKMPLPVKSSGELTDDEGSFILDATLKPANRKNPTVLAFIDSFIKCKHIGQASAECGIAASEGYKLRHRLDVATAIQKLIDKSAIKYGFDASEIMERTKEVVDFDPIAVQNPDGTFKNNFHDIEPSARRNIKKLKVKNLWGETEDRNGMKRSIIIGEVIEYEFYDKLKAAEMVGKEKEMFKNTTRVEHALTKDMESILLASAKKGQQASISFAPKTVVETTAIKVESEDE